MLKRETYMATLDKHIQIIKISEPKNIQTLKSRNHLLLIHKINQNEHLPNLKISEPKNIPNTNPRKIQYTKQNIPNIPITEPTDIPKSNPRNRKPTDIPNIPIFPIQEPETNQDGNSKKQSIKNRENDQGFIIGYRGEAHVYEMLVKLIKEKKLKIVNWNALSTDENDPCVKTVNGEIYHIKEDGDHYDLYAEDLNGEKYYFEVKSTNANHRNVELHQEQIKLAQNLNTPEEHHYVVCVLNVGTEPFAVFYKKDNNF